jgi:hypothetical protein
MLIAHYLGARESTAEALIGLMGAVVGAAAIIASKLIEHWLARREQDKVDGPRKAMLIHMLENPPPNKRMAEF